MERMLKRRAPIAALALLACAAATMATRSMAPSAPATATDAAAPASLPWWKRSLAHTVQEEWVFAQHMDQQHGPRWRTALPDKVVLHLWQAWQAERTGGGP
jgi:hypothetical protein